MIERYDIAIVGAGPAGLAAAQAATGHGARVALLDAQSNTGGQVWRKDVMYGRPGRAQRCIEQALQHRSLTWLPRTQLIHAGQRELLLQDDERAYHLGYERLILANGARELLLPFPGWTLPGVTGAGALQALAKQGWPLQGRRVIVAGSGPLLLAAAATAKKHGAEVLGIYEQASAAAVRNFAYGLWRWPGKAWQAATLRLQLAGIPYRCDSVVRQASGTDALHAVEIEGPHGVEHIACDLLAVGYGLVPNIELAQLLGCRLRQQGAHACVEVDEAQRTSIPHVFAAGELCGIGGRDTAWVEGGIAGHAAAGAEIPQALSGQRCAARDFAAALQRHFALAPRIRTLAQPDTLICRCEDVPLQALHDHADARSAKLATRCGMGACQGRICGSALAELGLFPRSGLRPPLFPARLATLGLSLSDHPQGSSP
jgi:D-hydroxyproline dehydrogenase subunit alpha